MTHWTWLPSSVWQHSRHGIARHRGWHPNTTSLVYGERDGMVVSTSPQYRRGVLRAARVLYDIVQQGGHVWVVNTSPQCAFVVQGLSHMHRESVSYSSHAWTPGTLTNWSSVSRSVLSYGMFEHRCSTRLSHDLLEFPRYRRVRRHFQGLISSQGVPSPRPDILILMNPGDTPYIVDEAARMHIPVIGFVESDTPCTKIHYPIPVSMGHISQIYHTLVLLLGMCSRK